MATYRYLARNWEGETAAGTLSAAGQREALEQLRAQELFVIQLKEQSAALQLKDSPSFKSLLARLQERKPKSRDFMVFCRQFAAMLQAGITVLQVLKIQAQQTENRALREQLREVTVEVERGGAFAGALEKQGGFFPRIMTSMVEAGEAGGILDAVMERLAAHFENQHDLEEKIRTATMYPLIVSMLTVAVMGLMVFFVLPQFAGIFEEMGFEMPLLTRILLALSGFVTGYWYLVIPLLVLLAGALLRYVRTPDGRRRLDRAQLRLPVYGKIYSNMIVARFARTLGVLLASGVGLLQSLELVEKVINNVVLAAALTEAQRMIRQGRPLALPLAASGLFPPMLVEMIHVGEESGSLDSMLSRTADFYEGELTFTLDRLSSVIEPVLIIFVGLFVGILLISIIQPMFGIYEMI